MRLVDESSVITKLWTAPADAVWITKVAVIATAKSNLVFIGLCFDALWQRPYVSG